MIDAIAPKNATVVEIAESYAAAGLSILPIKTDGSKAPAIGKWSALQHTRIPAAEIARRFAGNVGVGIIGGKISGNLEVVDIDDPALVEPFLASLAEELPHLVGDLTAVETPREGGGRHFYLRCESPPEGNQPLARDEAGNVLIETRGEGGYAVAPGSPAACHPSGRLYQHVAGSPLTAITLISDKERAVIHRIARSFNRLVKDTAPSTSNGRTGKSPGDDYNVRASWAEILEPAGWQQVSTDGTIAKWRRPGKSVGTSATSGLVSKAGNELFYVFSTSAAPFVEGECYNKFAAFTLLHHAGNHSAAASMLAAAGYGARATPGERVLGDDGLFYESDAPQARAAEPKKEQVDYTRITAAELATNDYKINFLIEGLLVEGQPCGIIGPKKALKTSLALDMGVAIATGGKFLGYFNVPEARTVAVMSAESGMATIQETCKRICLAAGVDLAETGMIFSDDVPKFGSLPHMDALERFLDRDAVDVLVIDPVYMAMSGGDAGNLFIQGELLKSVAKVCQERSVTLVLCHHMKKHRSTEQYAPGELDDAAWAGFAEFFRQWWMITRRAPYEPGTGEHLLSLSVGGSVGHGSLHGVDIVEGAYDPERPRVWQTAVRDWEDVEADADGRADEAKETKKAAREQRQLASDQSKLADAMLKHPQGASRSRLSEDCKLSFKRARSALDVMVEEGNAVVCNVKKGKNKATYDGFRLPREGEMI
jgi:hypothetical protein